jgi:anti-anti-sigma factor
MSTDNEVTTNDVLVVSSRRQGGRVVVELAGELDLHGCDRLTAEVEKFLDDSVEVVELDAHRLTFADSAGLRAILLTRAAVDKAGAQFRLGQVSPSVGRVIDLAGLGDLLLPAND